jgi:hypothetical protein
MTLDEVERVSTCETSGGVERLCVPGLFGKVFFDFFSNP